MTDLKEIPVPKFKYVGPHDAVDIEGVGTVRQGVAFDAPTSLARSLKDRDDFSPVKPPARRSTPAKPKES